MNRHTVVRPLARRVLVVVAAAVNQSIYRSINVHLIDRSYVAEWEPALRLSRAARVTIL